jgi:hypothetical protein
MTTKPSQSLAKQPIPLVFTEEQWVLIRSAVSKAMKDPGDFPCAQDLYPVALQIQQTLNRRMRDTGAGYGDVVFNFAGASEVTTELLYGGE